MKNINIFDSIEEKEKNKILKNLDTSPVLFSKKSTIIDNSNINNIIGVILKGEANVLKYDYDGNRFIIEKLEKNSLFGDIFSRFDGEIEVVAVTDCEVLLFSYEDLINKNKNRLFINNLFQLLTYKIKKINVQVDILSKKTIRDKLIKYFKSISNKKNIEIPFNYTDLADYLCVDRSAMMRELKKMKDEGIIEVNGKKIKLLT